MQRPAWLLVAASMMLLSGSVAGLGLGAGVPADDPLVIVGEHLVTGTHHWTQGALVPAGSHLIIRDADLTLEHDPLYCKGGTVAVCTLSIMVQGGRVTIENSVLRGVKTYEDGDFAWFIQGQYGSIHASGNQFLDMGGIRMESPGIEASWFDNNTFERGFTGVIFTKGATVHVRDNTFSDIDAPIALRDMSSTVWNNHITGAKTAINVQASTVGDKIQAGPVDIRGNTVTDSRQGILHLGNHPSRIAENTIIGGDIGITIGIAAGEEHLAHPLPLVTGNTLLGNERNLRAYVAGGQSAALADAAIPTLTVVGNRIVDATCNAVEAQTNAGWAYHIDARGNWWGDAAGPVPGRDGCAAVQIDDAAVTVDVGDALAVDPGA